MNGNDIVFNVIRVLDQASVPYVLVGSYSSNAYGIPRSTQDADFVIELGELPLSAIIDPLKPEVIFDPQLLFETVTGTYRWVGTHASGFKIELFQVGDDPFLRQRFQRRRQENIFGLPVWLPTPEDVIIQKLRWYSRARRPKDYDDARAVLAVQSGKLDLNYLEGWCDQHATRELFNELQNEVKRLGTDLS